jgi:hypothetical protein
MSKFLKLVLSSVFFFLPATECLGMESFFQKLKETVDQLEPGTTRDFLQEFSGLAGTLNKTITIQEEELKNKELLINSYREANILLSKICGETLSMASNIMSQSRGREMNAFLAGIFTHIVFESNNSVVSGASK